MAKEFKLTQESLDKLKEELEYLKTVREKEVAEQIKEARSFGDLSENSEYDEAKNEQGKLYSRIENIIAHAVVITDDMYGQDEVSPGCRFKVEDVEFGEVEEYHFVGSQEADPMDGKISDESPFGKAVLGKKVGQIVEVEAPAGTIQYKVIEIIK